MIFFFSFIFFLFTEEPSLKSNSSPLTLVRLVFVWRVCISQPLFIKCFRVYNLSRETERIFKSRLSEKKRTNDSGWTRCIQELAQVMQQKGVLPWNVLKLCVLRRFLHEKTSCTWQPARFALLLFQPFSRLWQSKIVRLHNTNTNQSPGSARTQRTTKKESLSLFRANNVITGIPRCSMRHTHIPRER